MSKFFFLKINHLQRVSKKWQNLILKFATHFPFEINHLELKNPVLAKFEPEHTSQDRFPPENLETLLSDSLIYIYFLSI